MMKDREPETGDGGSRPGSGLPSPVSRPPRTVIFTADDFGLSPALNAAVALAHRRGVLGCASLMAAGPHFSEAVKLARDLPDLCLGVHLTLIQGRAVLPPEKLPRLVDSQGRFLNDPVKTGWRYFREPRLLPEIERELRAQLETVLEAGVTPWHLNSHVNLHHHPKIFPLVVGLAREYGIPALRLSREDWRTTLALAPDGPLPKVAQGIIFALLCRRAAKLARAHGLIINDHLFGLLNDGRMTEAYLLGLAPRLQPGVTEIYCHPGIYADAELARWAPAYRRQEELSALLSPRLKEALAAAGAELSDFRALSQTA
ncbi:MAG: hopanoid biosynthesis-associated protein HpnK [Deltaproteobacteria bacterium]|nr:hopanoid biosynthesis-associated protein HpnK [Deltaproteobacteria bacterium]